MNAERETNAFELNARLLDVLNTVHRMHGDAWPARVEGIRPLLEEAARRLGGVSILSAAIVMARNATNDHNPHAALEILAAGAELSKR